jgi:hypothetical protein
MKLIDNTGTNRVIDALRKAVQSGASLSIASPALSLFAFFELRDLLPHVAHSRLILPDADGDLALLGSAADRAARNRLQARWLANECAKWILKKQTGGAGGRPPSPGMRGREWVGTVPIPPRFACTILR